MEAFKIYKICNITNPEDPNFCLGATRHKYLSVVWSNHKNPNRRQTIHEYIKAAGIHNFKCVLISEGTGDNEQMNNSLQEKILELNPPHKLEKQKRIMKRERKKPIKKAPRQKTVEEVIANKEKSEIYQRYYQRVYQPNYYIRNRDHIIAKQKIYTATHPINTATINDAIRASKKYYCAKCDRACVAQSALAIHCLSKKHLR